MTLKLRVTSWSTWLLLFLGTCMCHTAMIFCFVRFSGRGIHSDYCHLLAHHVWLWNVRSHHGLRALPTWQFKKSRRQWRDFWFSRSSGKITRLAIVRMNSLNQKPYETKKNNHLGKTNTSRNNKSHVDRDVTFSFKVTRDSHANGDSWNEFRDLKTSRNNIKIIAVEYIQAEIKKSHVDHNVTFGSKVTREGHANCNS